MFNIPPTKSTAAIKPEILPAQIKTWKVGQVLYGRAETGAPARSQVILRIGEQQLQAQTPVALEAGESLKLLVKELGDPPLLSIQGKAINNTAADQLKLFIAQQGDTLNTLKQLQTLQKQVQLPAAIQQPLQKLLQQLPDIQQASQAQALKSLLKNNAVFLESQLLKNADTPLENNFKSQLKQLQTELINTFPQLKINKSSAPTVQDIKNFFNQFQSGKINIKQLIDIIVNHLPASQLKHALNTIASNEGKISQPLTPLFKQLLHIIQQQATPQTSINHLTQQLQQQSLLQDISLGLDSLLNKITTQQLIPLSRDMDNTLLLVFSLIFKDNKDFIPIDFKIEESPASKTEGKKDWLINIKFELKSLGLIQARVHILDNQVSTFFQAEKSATLNTIQQQLPKLEHALQHAGFNIMQLNIEQHKIKQQPDYPKGTHILDEKI